MKFFKSKGCFLALFLLVVLSCLLVFFDGKDGPAVFRFKPLLDCLFASVQSERTVLAGLNPCDTFENATTGDWKKTLSNGNVTQMQWVPSTCTLPERGDSMCALRKLCHKKLSKIVVLGDSQGVHYTSSLRRFFVHPFCVGTKKGHTRGCGESRLYFGMDHDSGCMGCRGCESLSIWCSGTTIEYLGIEHVFDDRLAGSAGSLQLNSSQQVAGWYLSQPNNRPDLILVNSGLHDMETLNLDPQNPKYYKTSVRSYLTALLATRAKVVWIETTAVAVDLQPEKWHNHTTTSKSQQLNVMAREIASELGVTVIGALRVSSSDLLHSDGVHLHNFNSVYYDTIIQQIVLGQLLARNCDVSTLQ